MIFRQLFDADSATLAYLPAEEQGIAAIIDPVLDEFVRIMDNFHLAPPRRIHEAVPANLLGAIKYRSGRCPFLCDEVQI